MASIRRTLSPYQDRSRQNGNNFSPSHLKTSSRFGGPRKLSSRRNLVFTYLFFFLVGFLLAFVPPFNPPQLIKQDDDFAFELKRPPPFPPPPLLHQNQNQNQNLSFRFDYDHANKLLIVVTPTYNRPLQAFYLNRLAHLLRLLPPPLLWIVVEINAASPETARLLSGMGLMYRHLVSPNNLTNLKDRGVHQRNTALQHIQHHKLDGIVYFADDDNVYSLQLFHSLRDISRFGTWPVAMLQQSKNKATLEGPVCNGSQVIGWHTNEKSKRLRRFHVDMSGFAFNSTILWDPKRWKKPSSAPIRQLDTVKEGFQETTFIQQLVEDETQMEAIPLGCSKIMNWHLHLESHEVDYPKGWLLQKNLDAVLPID